VPGATGFLSAWSRAWILSAIPLLCRDNQAQQYQRSSSPHGIPKHESNEDWHLASPFDYPSLFPKNHSIGIR
jgi:hypothetical protein